MGRYGFSWWTRWTLWGEKVVTEREALVEALILIRQIARGDVYAKTRIWAYGQVEWLDKRIKEIDNANADNSST